MTVVGLHINCPPQCSTSVLHKSQRLREFSATRHLVQDDKIHTISELWHRPFVQRFCCWLRYFPVPFPWWRSRNFPATSLSFKSSDTLTGPGERLQCFCKRQTFVSGLVQFLRRVFSWLRVRNGTGHTLHQHIFYCCPADVMHDFSNHQSQEK